MHINNVKLIIIYKFFIKFTKLKIKKMKRIALVASLLGIIFCVAGCKNENNVEFTYEVKNIEFVFEAPYVGSETKSAEVNLNLDSAFATNKANIAKISKVSLENVGFTIAEGKNFDNFGGLTVELQSDNANVKTITVGSTNEIGKGKTNFTFAGSENKNADDFFDQKKFNIMLSSNMKVEDTIAYKVIGTLKFKVKAGKI
jgi:hypothetical protein